MEMIEIIAKKREGFALSTSEMNHWVEGYTNGTIPDYQVSALLMAIVLNGMDVQETVALTLAMASSGDQLDLSSIAGIKVDKHSTGGVGDKVTLVVAPLVASCGIPVLKMSGRGLGHTGGTIDKLSAISGFTTKQTMAQAYDQVQKIGIAITEQTGNLVPADKKIYALRDVTATVNSKALIASSVMSKKIAAGADKILLDVKVGSGAFMKNVDDASALAKIMCDIGQGANRETVALLSDMHQPLGTHVGNALEVIEAIQVLKGQGDEALTQVCKTIAAHMVVLGGKAENLAQAFQLIAQKLSSGTALAKFMQWIAAQGGDLNAIKQPSTLLQKRETFTYTAKQTGYWHCINCEAVGIAANHLDAGRWTKESVIDLSAGIVLHHKSGDWVQQNERLATFYATTQQKIEKAVQTFQNAYEISEQHKEYPLFYGIV
ncbi:MAG: thymidine phosphorylase [Hyphomonadaceae bacterium]|nr:thymidine phosphorylase [Clostridia bacterium]